MEQIKQFRGSPQINVALQVAKECGCLSESK